MEWIQANKEWLFGGAGITFLGYLAKVLAARFRRRTGHGTETNNDEAGSARAGDLSSGQSLKKVSVSEKNATRILFIDDDVKFKVVKILKNSGWTNTSLVKDVGSLNDPALINADIVFVDIQGVGLLCGFKDEGLGLASAIKEKYPAKKLVIYSAEPRGAMFHDALRKADHSLEKNADPYEFERLVERFVCP